MTTNFSISRRRKAKDLPRAISLTLVVFAIVLAGTLPLRAQNATLTEWTVPSPQNAVNVGQSILPAGRNAVYFTESVGGKIGRLDLKNDRITEWMISHAGNVVNPNGLARGEDRIFFTEVQPFPGSSTGSSGGLAWGTISGGGGITSTSTPSGSVGSLDPETGQVTLWTLQNGSPAFPVYRNGLIYFIEPFDDRVGSLNPSTGDLREWQLPAPVPSGGGSGCISFAQPSCGGFCFLCDSLEDFFAGVPTSSQVLINILTSLDADSAGENLWFSEDVSHRIARLNIPTGTLTEWTIPPTNGAGAFDVHLNEGLVYFTAGGAVMRLDPGTNVIAVWNDPGATNCPPPSPGNPVCLPTTLFGLVVTEHREDSNESEGPAKVDFSIPGIAVSTPSSVNVINPQIGEFVTSDAAHTDYSASPITTVLSPVENQATATTWIAPKSATDVEPTATQLPAVQAGGFTFWTLQGGPGAAIISKLPDGGLVFTTRVGDKITLLNVEKHGRSEKNQ